MSTSESNRKKIYELQKN